MKKLLLVAVAVLGWTTISHAAITWTCTRDFVMPFATGYLAIGDCVAGGALTYTAGGDFVGAAADAASAGTAFCGSAKVLKRALLSGARQTAVNAPTAYYEIATFRIQLYGQGASITGLSEIGGAQALSNLRVQYIAVCQ